MRIETLEPRQLLTGLAMITEFMAKNDGYLEDGDGNAPDWIEIQNVGDTALDLAGYRLTDDPINHSRWVFPSLTVDPGEYLVVFASSQDVDDYVDADGNLHTNFALSAGGEYLAPVGPDGTVLSEYGTTDIEYPEQIANTSYGVAQREVFVDEHSEATFWQPLGGDVDTLWTEIDFDALAHGFSSGQAAMGYESEPDSRNSFSGEILTDVPDGAHAFYARMEFDLENSSYVNRLILRLKYDNGFVAHLNGVNVADANAPEGAGWFSTALERTPTDSRALEFVDFDLTEHVSQLVDGTNVLAIHGLNHFSDRDDMLLVPQLIASVNSPDARIGYMPSPSPGAENVADESVFAGTLGETTIDGEPGFFDAPFSVTISTETADAEIRYTTDGRPPTATTGTVYSGPIQVDSTTTLRAAAFKEDHIPSNVDTQTYLFLEEIIRQPADPPGLPSTWEWSRTDYPADYEMDPRIVDDPAYLDEIVDGLKSIRTMSIVLDPDDLFGPEGMHNNTDLHGLESEHPASVEIINPDGSLAVQVDAGVRIHGNWTRRFNISMKQSFRLSFRDQYGATKLEYPLFPDAPVDRFDSVILHAGKLRDDAQLVRDSWGRDTNLAMGNLETHSTYVHLYLNGLYWGLYNPFERADSQFAETYLGGRDQDYDALQYEGSVLAIDGTADRYNEMLGLIRSGMRTQEAYEEFLRFVDLDSLVDFLLVNQYMAHGEHELRMIGSRVGDADFRFLVWDLDEQGMTNARAREDIETYFPTGIYDQLRRHPEIAMHYADRAHKHLFNDGALTPDAAEQRWDSRVQEIYSAAIAETARWGDMRWNDSVPRTPVTRDVEMLRERARQEQFFPERSQALVDELRRLNVYPDIDAPILSQHGGPVPADFQLTMSHPNTKGVIVYTLDSTDPRQYGGQVAPESMIYEGSRIPITSETVVKARVLSDGEWSALSEADFVVVGPDSPYHLRITEVNYHPHDANPVLGLGEANVDSDQFQYVELTNTSAETIDIGDVQLARAIQFTFPAESALGPGQHVLLVNDRAAFESRYGPGLNIGGEFDGSLSVSQGLLELRDSGGRRMQSVSYSTQSPWPQRANGAGSSLEIIDPFGPSGEPTNWRSSREFGGSPGAAGTETDQPIAITEVLAHSDLPAVDMVELHNTTSAPVDISGWYVSDSGDDHFKVQIPSDITVPAGGYHILTETQLGFGFDSSRGDDVWLIQADATGKPLRFVDHVQFGPSGAAISMGPGPDGSWLPLAQQTFGRENSGLLFGDVIISEVHYAPLDPDGDRRQLHADDFEYIELYNQTDSPVDISDWRLSGGVEMTLPAGTTVDAQQSLLVVPFDTTDWAKAAIFRVVHDIHPSVPFVGPYPEPLGDDGDVVRLERPDQPPAEEPTFAPYLYVDEVAYQVIAPWPVEAAGTGSSLTRVSADSYGNSPASWTARTVSPGAVDFTVRMAGDANEDGRFDQLDLIRVLQGNRFQTGQPATWGEGDWNDDGVFDQLDLIAALQTGSFLEPLAAIVTAAMKDVNTENLDRAFAGIGT